MLYVSWAIVFCNNETDFTLKIETTLNVIVGNLSF